MQYMMMPLELHSDGGLGATGESFEQAARLLAEAEAASASHSHLPISFLYRHAIELFLKSMIVVVHRGLRINYGPHPHTGPGFVAVDGKWKPLHRVHSLATLLAHYIELTRRFGGLLDARCATDWKNIPAELLLGIAEIEKADATSTYFRYPDGRSAAAEEAKSSWKPKTPEEILAQANADGKPVKAFLVYQPDGETLIGSYQYDDAPLADLIRVLADTASILSGAHTGLRVELAGGY